MNHLALNSSATILFTSIHVVLILDSICESPPDAVAAQSVFIPKNLSSVITVYSLVKFDFNLVLRGR